MATVNVLPNELWFHVAHFISKDTLINLYGINKLFMDVALSEKYADVQIGTLFSQYDPCTACQYLDHISQSHISSRIRHLRTTLSFELFEQNPYQNRHLTRFLPGLSIRGLTSKQQDSLRHRQDVLQNMRLAVFKFLKSLHSINHLEINYDHGVYPRALSSVFLSFLWRRFGSHVRTLTVHSSLPGIAGLLSGTTNFGALTKLHLNFDGADYTQPFESNDLLVEANTRAIARFCNLVSNRLQSLEFSASSTPPRLALLFRELGYFRDLESFKLVVNFPSRQDWDDEHLVRFVSVNGSMLKHLELPLHPVLTEISSSLGRLRSLSTLPSQHWAGHPTITASQIKERRMSFLQRYTSIFPSSLLSLCLDDSVLGYSDLTHLLDYLPKSTLSTLRHLRIRTVAIHPQLFITLHERLPLLSSLEITARTAQHEYTEDGCYHCDIRRLSQNDIQEIFIRTMAAACLCRWPLYSLSITLEKCPVVGLEKSWWSLLRELVPTLEDVKFEIKPPIM